MSEIKLSKLKNFTVSVKKLTDDDGNVFNPYKKGSLKRELFSWALNEGTFTKEQFLNACVQIKNDVEFVTRFATDEAMARAWFNEFYSKHGVFELNESSN